MRQIGIYSGTFDPVHAGHIAFGLETLRQLRLDEVIYLPETIPRYKTGVTPLKHRLAMLELATTPYEGLRPLSVHSSQFTIADTLPELQQLFPDGQFTFLLGSDVLRSLSLWPGIEELAQTAQFAIGLRDKDSTESLTPILNSISALNPQYTLITTSFSEACSSIIRTSDNDHANASIAAYARQNNLYKK